MPDLPSILKRENSEKTDIWFHWQSIEDVLPPNHSVVMACKIDSVGNLEKRQKVIRRRSLWFDYSNRSIIAMPTHWRNLKETVSVDRRKLPVGKWAP